MAHRHKLLKDTLLYGIAHFGSSALAFLMLPIYTHYFSVSEFGTWDLAVTTLTLLTPLITLELVTAAYRWLLDAQTHDERRTIISTSLRSIGRSLIFFNSTIILMSMTTHFQIPYMWEALLLINLSIFSSFIQQCARGLQFNVLFASLGIIQTIIIVSLNLLFIFVFNLRIEALFYSSSIAHLATFLFAWNRMGFATYISLHIYSKRLMKSFLIYSLPIIPGAISWWIMTMSDRYMITYFLGIEFNGLYAIASKIPAVLLMINTIFFLAWKDSAIITYNSLERNSYYSKIFRRFFRLMATTVICLTLFTKPLLTFAIAEDYFSSWKYIGLLLIGAFFHTLSLFWSAGYHGAKKTNIILVTSVIGAFINVTVNFILIPYIGLYAVALSTLLAFLTTWIIRIQTAKEHFTINIYPFETISLFIIIVIANIIPFQLGNVGVIVSGIISVGFFGCVNWNSIVYVYNVIQDNLRKIKEN